MSKYSELEVLAEKSFIDYSNTHSISSRADYLNGYFAGAIRWSREGWVAGRRFEQTFDAWWREQEEGNGR